MQVNGILKREIFFHDVTLLILYRRFVDRIKMNYPYERGKKKNCDIENKTYMYYISILYIEFFSFQEAAKIKDLIFMIFYYWRL